MNKLEELKRSVQKVMDENKPAVVYNSESDRLIREVEAELIRLQLKTPFNINLNSLTQNSPDALLCNGKFTESQYSLEWADLNNKGFRLILRNIPYNNPKILITLPDNIKDFISPYLKPFCEHLNKSFSK